MLNLLVLLCELLAFELFRDDLTINKLNYNEVAYTNEILGWNRFKRLQNQMH